jgi:hypothetical protein
MLSIRYSDKWVDLPTRAFNLLRQECEARGWPFTIASVMRFTAAELRRVPNCGGKSVQDIRAWLGKRRLALSGERPVVPKPRPAPRAPDPVAALRAELARAEGRAARAESEAAYHERSLRALQHGLRTGRGPEALEHALAAERARTAYWQRRTRILALALAQAGQAVPPLLDMDDVAMADLGEALAAQHATH